MGLQCSIFGHKYGDVQSERERRENDNEVIITARETKTCTRCGETIVVSENKEVRTVRTAGETPTPDGTASTNGTSRAEASADVGAEVIDSSQDPEDGYTTDVTEKQGSEGGYTTDVSRGVDDGHTTGRSPDRGTADGTPEQSGSAAPATEPDGESTPREHGSEDDETATYSRDGIRDAETGEEIPESPGDGPPRRKNDAEILDSEEGREPGEWPQDWSGDGADDVEPPGEWPEETTGDSDDWRPETDFETDETGSEEPEIEPTRDALTVPEGEFYCPECGFATRVESSSLREGDFCPQCHGTALDHRAD